MKTAPLMYLTLIFVTTLIFAVVYSSFEDIVETYPVTCSVILIPSLVFGMYGVMDNIIFNRPQANHHKK